VKFSEWITKKYIEWRGDSIGHDRSITDFAKSIGVSQSLMSHWMNGDRAPRGHKTISKLAAIYPEIYEILGIEKPETDSPWNQLPLPFRERLEAATSEINLRYQQEGISPETDADGRRALIIADEVFKEYGISISVAEDDD
jgi:transcriptional regulator with XRE-family HTH domain